jgi:Glutamine amidotransferase domain
MADLLATISHDRSRSVSVGKLLAAHESLRGASTSSETVATGWAEVSVVDRPVPGNLGLEAAGGGWTAWAGAPRAAGRVSEVALAQLQGQFALARLEPGAETLRIAADPFGIKPLYVAEAGGVTWFSSSALALAKHLRLSPSRAGLEAFLRVGNHYGRRTAWEGMRRVQPGEEIRFTPAGPESQVYWRPAIDPDVRALGFEESAELCADRGAAAIAAAYGDGRPWLDLTGGFDTRLVSLLAQRGGLDFLTNTIGDERAEDTILARRIAATAGWPWTRFDLPPDWAEVLPGRIDEAVAWSDCNLDALGLAAVIEGHREKAATETALLNGGGGEHFRDFPWSHELFAAGRSTTANLERFVRWRLLGPLDLSVFAGDPTAAAAARLVEELEHRTEPFAAMPNTFQGDVVYAYKSTGHFGAYQAAADGWVHMELPFYLSSLWTTTTSISPRHRNFHRLMRETMSLLDPTIAAIQTETGGPAEPLRPGNAYRFAPYVWRRGKRFAARVQGQIFKGTDPAASVRELAASRTVAALRAEGRLDPAQMRSAPVYDRERLEAVLDAAVKAPASVDWTLIGRVVTAELALEGVDAGLG